MPRSNARRTIARLVSSGRSPPKFCQSPSEIAGSCEPAAAAAPVRHAVVAVVGGDVAHGREPTLTSMAAARLLALLRRFRLPLAILLAAWLLGPPAVRDAVPLWLAFLVALALEAHFVLTNYRSAEPFFGTPDRRPDAADRERYGTGGVAEWEIVEVEGERLWLDLAEHPGHDEPRARRAPHSPSRAGADASPACSPRRSPCSPSSPASCSSSTAAAGTTSPRRPGPSAEARFSAEAARVAGKPVRLRCDTSGRIVGAVQHADGVAIVGGDRAYLTPELCFALYRLTHDGEVPSFSRTARAIAVLAHEAWHLRGVRDEGVTECYALQSGVRVGRRLGLDEERGAPDDALAARRQPAPSGRKQRVRRAFGLYEPRQARPQPFARPVSLTPEEERRSSTPGHVRRAVVADAEGLEARAVRRESAPVLAPAAAAPRRPADLGMAEQPREGHELDVRRRDERLRPERRLDAEHVALAYAGAASSPGPIRTRRGRS